MYIRLFLNIIKNKRKKKENICDTSRVFNLWKKDSKSYIKAKNRIQLKLILHDFNINTLGDGQVYEPSIWISVDKCRNRSYYGSYQKYNDITGHAITPDSKCDTFNCEHLI